MQKMINSVLRKISIARAVGPAETLRLAKLNIKARLPKPPPPPAPTMTIEEMQNSADRAVLRRVFWGYRNNNKLGPMWVALKRLEDLQRMDPRVGESDYLDKLSSSIPPELRLLDAIEPGKPLQIEPVSQRICYFLHNSLPYSSGGYATRAHGLATALRRKGYEFIATTRPGFPLDNVADLEAGEVREEETVDGVSYCRLLAPRRRSMSMLDYMLQSADVIEAHLRKHRPSIVMAASNYQTGFPALLAARRLGLPFVYEVRGFWEITRISREPKFCTHPSFFLQEFMEAELCRRADQVFTLTGAMRNELARRGVPEQQIILLPNACDPENFVPRPRASHLAERLGIPDNVPVIGYIGSFVQYEGLDDLARACAMLKQRGVVFRLMIVGNEDVSGQDAGPITESIREAVERAGFSDWLIMPGRVPHDEVPDYYSLIDIAPFPRKPQPVTEMVSPMKPLEAMAMERAVLVSSVEAMAEMIQPGTTGDVFEKGDIADLANKLEMFISDASRRAALGAAARLWVLEHRTWARTAAIADEVFTAMQRKSGSSPVDSRDSSPAARS